MNKNSSLALILIALAITGAGISYHFTLESRFAAIEQKLDQNSVALQQYQITQETVVSAKTAALNKLSNEVDALQTSMEPLGKVTHDQTDSLSDIRKQIASIQQSQQTQVDAQKKLADYAAQLDKIRHDVQAQAAQVQAQAQAQAQPVAPAPATVNPAPTVVPVPAAHASVSTAPAPLPVAPKTTQNAVDLRPAEIMATDASVRALPVALPVTPALSDVR
jgi:hypothetical protein